MVSIRLTVLLVGLFFSLVVLRSSIASSLQATTIFETKASKYVASKSHQGPIEDAILVMRGRKMLVHEVGRKDREKVRGVKGKDSANSGATPSVANFDDGDDDEEMGELNVEHELSDHRGLPSKVNVVDLIPFSADYGRARTHPPKNN